MVILDAVPELIDFETARCKDVDVIDNTLPPPNVF